MSYRLKILLIDNYDSFTYNLQDYFLQLGTDCTVIRNDELPLKKIQQLSFDALVLSPGPKKPADAGILLPLIAYYFDKKPILGICLGHQGIGEFFGANLQKAKLPMHGKVSQIQHQGHPLFDGLPNSIGVMRYHSLIINNLEETPIESLATTADGEVMAIAHESLSLYGFQFHPESILTPDGMTLLRNWLKIVIRDQLQIRKMQIADIDAVYKLCKHTFMEENVSALSDPEKGIQFFLEKLIDKNKLEKRLKGTSHFFVATFNDHIVGVTEIDKSAYIRLAYIAQTWIGKGIGKQLMKVTLDFAKTHFSSKIVTLDSAPKAVSFYQDLGFKILEAEKERDGIRYVPMLCKISKKI